MRKREGFERGIAVGIAMVLVGVGSFVVGTAIDRASTWEVAAACFVIVGFVVAAVSAVMVRRGSKGE